MLGLAAHCRAADDERATSALRKLGEGLSETGGGDAATYSFGAHVGKAPGQPWHTWGLRQAAALSRAGGIRDDETLVDGARREGSALHTYHCSSQGPSGMSRRPTTGPTTRSKEATTAESAERIPDRLGRPRDGRRRVVRVGLVLDDERLR